MYRSIFNKIQIKGVLMALSRKFEKAKKAIQQTPLQNTGKTNEQARLNDLTKFLKSKGASVELNNDALNELLSLANRKDIATETSEYETPDLRILIEAKRKRDMARVDGIIGLPLKRFPMLEKAIDGLQRGFYLMGGDPNIGKTTTLMNIVWDTLMSGNDTYALIYSLDDSVNEMLTRLLGLAIEGVLTMEEIQKPATLGDELVNLIVKSRKTDDKVSKRDIYEVAYAMLLELANERLMVFDIATIRTQQIMQFHLEKTLRKYKDKKLVVMIDGLLNLEMEGLAINESRALSVAKAKFVKMMVDIYNIPILATIELRKAGQSMGVYKEPELSDIMETGKFAYNANLVWMIAHDTSSGELNTNIIINKLKYVKNKISSFRGAQYIRFHRNSGYMSEISYDGREQYLAQFDKGGSGNDGGEKKKWLQRN